MVDKDLQNHYSKFISHLVSVLRKIPLYPAQHPAVISSIKDSFLALTEILNAKNPLTLSLSSDNKIIIENEPVDKKNLTVDTLVPCFHKLNIENVTFSSGISEKEMDEFLRMMSLGKEETQSLGEIAKALSGRGITHIKIDQFSYIKVDKEKEVLVAGKEEISALSGLKDKIKDYAKGKIKSREEIQLIENDIFGLIVAEFREKKKIGAAQKNIFKKFFLASENKDEILVRLKMGLTEAGCSPEEADAFALKLAELVSKKPEIIDTERIKAENEELKEKVRSLQQQMDKFKGMETETKKIKNEKQKLENVMHNMSEGVVVVDPEGKLLMINPIAETLLGVSKQNIGQSIKEMVKDEHLLAMAREQDIELFSRSESTKRVLKTSSAVVEDPNGNAVGMVTVLNDITRQKELERLKSDFVSNVSHELRSPLIAIEKSVSLILSKAAGEVSKDQEQFLSIAERNLKRLTLLINDLLDLSKLEAGKMTVKFQEASMAKVINECVMTFGNWAKTKSIKLEANIPEVLPLINIDPDRITQVLSNLISNAIKFTPASGSVLIAARHDAQAGNIEVSVSDTGTGIAQENLGRVFERFYQAAEKKPNDISGTGIGLSIAKEIVELHSGNIRAESEAGKGTKFIFTLPLAQAKGGVTR